MCVIKHFEYSSINLFQMQNRMQAIFLQFIIITCSEKKILILRRKNYILITNYPVLMYCPFLVTKYFGGGWLWSSCTYLREPAASVLALAGQEAVNLFVQYQNIGLYCEYVNPFTISRFFFRLGIIITENNDYKL